MKFLHWLVLCASFMSSQVQALTLDNVLVNGLAEYVPYKKSYYIATLLTEEPVRSAEEVFALSGPRYMVFTTTADNWSPRNFSSHWRNAISINNTPGDLESYDLAFRRFAVMLRVDPLSTGDQIVIGIRDADSPVKVTLNGRQTLEVQRQDFFNFMVRAWIGKRPPSSSFKAKLLSGVLDPSLADRFDGILHSDNQVRLGN